MIGGILVGGAVGLGFGLGVTIAVYLSSDPIQVTFPLIREKEISSLLQDSGCRRCDHPPCGMSKRGQLWAYYLRDGEHDLHIRATKRNASEFSLAAHYEIARNRLDHALPYLSYEAGKERLMLLLSGSTFKNVL